MVARQVCYRKSAKIEQPKAELCFSGFNKKPRTEPRQRRSYTVHHRAAVCSSVRLGSGKDRVDRAAEKQDFLADDIPHQVEIHVEIIVDQSIAHAGHCAPRHFGRLRAELPRNLLRRFADDLEAADSGALQRRILKKRVATHPRRRVLPIRRLSRDVPRCAAGTHAARRTSRASARM